MYVCMCICANTCIYIYIYIYACVLASLSVYEILPQRYGNCLLISEDRHLGKVLTTLDKLSVTGSLIYPIK